jgi:hypothetical protein
MAGDNPSPVTSESANPRSEARNSQPEPGRRGPAPGVDPGLRRMLKWVFAALILTVLFAILVVEVTLRWFQ